MTSKLTSGIAKLVRGSFDRNIFRHQNHILNEQLSTNIFRHIFIQIIEA